MDQKEQEIIEQAMQLFTRYGIKSVTMDEFSRHIGISKKTLYQYFADKNELVEKTIHALIDKNACNIEEIENKQLNAIEELFELYRIVNEMIKSHNPVLEFDLQRYFPKIYKKLRELQRNNTLNMMLANLNKGKSEGFYRGDLNVEILAKLNLMRTEYIMHSDLVTQEEMHSKSFFHEIFKYHVFGIISKKGWIYLNENYPEFVNN
jgi:TetR/AcrR family transcriptional regulator, cholesterol catabolism regulator